MKLGTIKKLEVCQLAFLLIDDVTSMSLAGSLMALTHLILINLFIKLELNNFLLPPLLSIVFVQDCSVVCRFLTRGDEENGKAYFLQEKWRAWVRVCRAHDVGHHGFMTLFFHKYVAF